MSLNYQKEQENIKNVCYHVFVDSSLAAHKLHVRVHRHVRTSDCHEAIRGLHFTLVHCAQSKASLGRTAIDLRRFQE